jgi:hypothetical protein
MNIQKSKLLSWRRYDCQINFVFAFMISSSSINAQDLGKIKQPVFGNLILGSSYKEYQRSLDSLRYTDVLGITKNTNHHFFTIVNKGSFSQKRVLLFPIAQFNPDSMITRIVYHIYVLEFTSVQAIESSNAPEKDKELVRELTRETVKKLNLLTTNFSLTSNLDKQFSMYVPEIPQGSGFENSITRKTISDFLNQKYGDAITNETTGSEYKDSDFTFSKVSIWKPENIDIKLITRRFPKAGKSDEFYHVLIYEYNSEVSKKYNLYKRKNLTDTF